MDVARLLRELREREQISQRELAARAGVSAGQLSRFETGARLPSLPMLDRLLAACGCDVELRLVQRHADLEAEFERLAALPWEQRCGIFRAMLLRRLVEADCGVVVGGSWAVTLHGIPAEHGLGVLLVPPERLARFAAAFNAGGPTYRQLDGVNWGVGLLTSPLYEQLAPGAEVPVRWRLLDGSDFRIELAPPPPHEVLLGEAAPLGVVAASALVPGDGVRADVLEAWRAWRSVRELSAT